MSRALRTLAEHGLVDRDPATRAYRLGWAFFAAAARAGDARLLAAGRNAVRELVAVTGERAHLSVLHGADVLTLVSESPPHAIQAAGWVGRLVPAYCASAGRALLLDHTREELRELFAAIEFVPRATNTPRTLDEVVERIEAARVRGYALADEELEPGLVAAAAPVRDFRGRIVGALNASGPKFRLAPRLDEVGEAVARAATRLGTLLGT